MPFKSVQKIPTIHRKETPNGQYSSFITRKLQIKAAVRYLYISSLKQVMGSHISSAKIPKFNTLMNW